MSLLLISEMSFFVKKLQVSKVEEALKPWRTVIISIDDGLRLKRKESSLALFSVA